MKLVEECSIYSHWPYHIEYGQEIEDSTEQQQLSDFLTRFSECYFVYEEETHFAKPKYSKLFGECITVKIYAHENAK